MDDNLKIAKEMLTIAKMLVAKNDFSKRNEFNKSMGTKLTTPQFKSVQKALTGDEEEDLENAPLEKVAQELLSVASELMKDAE